MTSQNHRTPEAPKSDGTSGKTPSSRRTIGYVSGIVVATGAAVALGVNFSHRSNASAGTPIVSESCPTGGLTSNLAGSGKSPQVAQASGDDDLRSKEEAVARLSAQDDGSEGGTADVRTFESVYGLVEDHYVDQLPDNTKLSRGTVRGMISSLNDPNSFFLEPDQRALLEAEAQGTFAGIGAVTNIVGQKKDGYTEYKIVVVDPLPGSPSAKAGLKAGDTITHVDGKWILGSDPLLKLNKLMQKLRDRESNDDTAYRAEFEVARKRVLGGIGLLPAQMLLRKGTTEKHTLTVQRAGVAEPLKLSMVNSLTTVDPVSTSAVGNGKATVVKVSLFTEKTSGEVKTALAKVAKGQGVVLDLRGNPGGSVPEAAMVGSLLSPSSPFALQIGPNGKRTKLAGSGGAAPTHSLVVLVDKGTARAAEALAASLQDSGVGTLIGGRTFGDGMARGLYSLGDGSGFTMTTGKLISPKGYDWQMANGIAPRVALAPGLTEDQIVAKAVAVLQSPPQRVATVPATAVKKPQP